MISGQVHNLSFPNLVSMDYANSDQSYFFTIKDFLGNVADVYAVSAFKAEDLQITLVNLLEDIFGGTGYPENLFYLQVFPNKETTPWQLVLDNDAGQIHAEDYTGFFALDEKNFYALKPITHISGKKGPQEIYGSIGYEVFNSQGKSVAAVKLVDKGEVYLNTEDPSERFLLSTLLASLLL